MMASADKLKNELLLRDQIIKLANELGLTANIEYGKEEPSFYTTDPFLATDQYNFSITLTYSRRWPLISAVPMEYLYAALCGIQQYNKQKAANISNACEQKQPNLLSSIFKRQRNINNGSR